MNHLVFLEAQAGELEKILSGVKTMLVKEFDPTQATAHPIHPGDSLYFLRNMDDCAVRVKAAVVRVLFITNCLHDDLPHILKEMQPRLQFTEDQFNHWSAKQQFLLVEYEAAHKISAIQVAAHEIADPSGWNVFEDFTFITE